MNQSALPFEAKKKKQKSNRPLQWSIFYEKRITSIKATTAWAVASFIIVTNANSIKDKRTPAVSRLATDPTQYFKREERIKGRQPLHGWPQTPLNISNEKKESKDASRFTAGHILRARRTPARPGGCLPIYINRKARCRRGGRHAPPSSGLWRVYVDKARAFGNAMSTRDGTRRHLQAYGGPMSTKVGVLGALCRQIRGPSMEFS